MPFSKAAILGTAALALGLTFSAPDSALISLGPNKALADVDININVGTFYDRLGSQGDWVSRSGAYVFVPAVSPGWRPYTLGHWEYTRRYGWLWVSDEPFGWATYHYGRWGYGDDIGWYWVPATRWAPAWVSWRRSTDYVAWAPLPPDAESGLSINIDIDSDRYADRYWAVVPGRQFLALDIGRVVIRDRDDRFRRVFRETRPLGRVRVENTIVVNNVINVTEIERVTRKKVRVKEVREVRDVKRAGKSTAENGDTVDVFSPEPDKNVEAKPRKVKSVEEVATRKRKNEPSAEEQATGSAATDQGQSNQATVGTRKKDRQQNASEGNAEQGNQVLTKKQRRELRQTQDEGGTVVTKKKRRQIQQSEDSTGNQALKRKANRNDKALRQMQKNQGNQQDNQNQNRRKKQKCIEGAANCPG